MTIIANNKILSDNKLKDKVGGDANESRFGGSDREMRKRKSITIPSVNSGSRIILEQGWNSTASKKDVVRIRVILSGNKNLVVKREDFEQALAYLSQGDELLKYVQPIIKNKQQ